MNLADFAVWGYGMTAVIYAGFMSYLYAGWRSGKARNALERDARVGGYLLLAIVFSFLWAMASLWYAWRVSRRSATEELYILYACMDTLRIGGWFAFLLVLLRPILGKNWSRFLVVAVIAVGTQVSGPISVAFTLTSDIQAYKLVHLGSLISAVLGLVLIEQLYLGVPVDVRRAFKPLCMGLGAAYMFELYLFADAFLSVFGPPDPVIWSARGPVHALIVPLIAMSGARNPSWSLRISLSRAAVFHSTTLGLSGLYLFVVAFLGLYVRDIWGQALQTVLLFAALLLLGSLMFSSVQRAKLRVFLSKHLFPYRYDYRAEWLRFTQSLSSADGQSNLGQSVVVALANLVESPGGALWLRRGSGDEPGYTIQASVNLPEQPDVMEPMGSSLLNFMQEREWVINLEEYRRSPAGYPGLVLPDWLSARFPDAWLLIPLIGGAGLIGFVLLLTPRTRFEVDWEVLDLLKTAQHQAASDLERMQAAEDLLEARKFESFTRMTAFVVHDLKNLVAQLSLMLRNAERHKDNPEFQADMLETVAHVEAKMRGLMLQLQEKRSIDPPRALNLVKTLENIRCAKQGRRPAMELDAPPGSDTFMVLAHFERLERVIGHVVQNAIEATPEDGRVSVSLAAFGPDRVRIVVEDTGCGMSEDFIRERLARPFETTKASGMGIGVYETRQYIRELGGEVSYESREGVGTQVMIELPLLVRLDVENGKSGGAT